MARWEVGIIKFHYPQDWYAYRINVAQMYIALPYVCILYNISGETGVIPS